MIRLFGSVRPVNQEAATGQRSATGLRVKAAGVHLNQPGGRLALAILWRVVSDEGHVKRATTTLSLLEGASGQVLTSGGSGSAVSWADPTGGGSADFVATGSIGNGAVVVLKSDGTVGTVTVSAAANVSVTGNQLTIGTGSVTITAAANVVPTGVPMTLTVNDPGIITWQPIDPGASQTWVNIDPY